MPEVTITPSEDGPYIVSGPVRLVAPDGHEIEHPDPNGDLPLRGLFEQAVLRWHARYDRLRRDPGELIGAGPRRFEPSSPAATVPEQAILIASLLAKASHRKRKAELRRP